MEKQTVGLLGATGETGRSILEALNQDAEFDVIALARSSSLTKLSNLKLQRDGVQLRALDLDGSEGDMVAALDGIDIMISAIGPRDQLAQLPLVLAAKKAGVKRFIPCGFQPIVPVGVHQSRDQKEEVYRLIEQVRLPYTIIDVGWCVPMDTIPGDGNVASARTDLRDVGKYVARVIKDIRTLDKKVFVYNELWITNKIIDLLEELTGETIDRKYASAEEYKEVIQQAVVDLDRDPQSIGARAKKVLAEYALSWGIRGENTPDVAENLGYLDGKALYPDFEFVTFRRYVREVIDGNARAVYAD